MKRDKVLIFTKILYVLFAVGTVGAMVIVYSDADGSMAYNFLFGYVFLAFFMLLYIPIVTIMNSRKMRWTEIGRKILKFLGLFILISILNFGFDYLIRPSDIDAFRIFSSALGVSFGITFIDVIFLKKKESLKESVSK
ncbi:MAG TPA: hypothetical protein VLM88_03680 [Proteiniclasticum sp.]|nr:hypothetical protein [Proteiniclasticum sp.]